MWVVLGELGQMIRTAILSGEILRGISGCASELGRTIHRSSSLSVEFEGNFFVVWVVQHNLGERYVVL